jgi:hypothetical protein
VTGDAAIRARIAELLEQRGEGRTVCPSEVARALAPDDERHWRALMDDVRRVAFTLADAGELEVTQGGAIVDGRTARGPIRLRRPGGAMR